MVDKRGFDNLRVRVSVAKEMHCIRDAAIHVVSIPIKVNPDQFSVRLKQLFYAWAIVFDDNVRLCQLALLQFKLDEMCSGITNCDLSGCHDETTPQ